MYQSGEMAGNCTAGRETRVLPARVICWTRRMDSLDEGDGADSGPDYGDTGARPLLQGGARAVALWSVDGEKEQSME